MRCGVPPFKHSALTSGHIAFDKLDYSLFQRKIARPLCLGNRQRRIFDDKSRKIGSLSQSKLHRFSLALPWLGSSWDGPLHGFRVPLQSKEVLMLYSWLPCHVSSRGLKVQFLRLGPFLSNCKG